MTRIVRIRQLKDRIARFLKLPISLPRLSGPSTQAEVMMAYADLKSVIPSYGSPVISLGTPKAFETSTKSYVITIVHAKQVAYIYSKMLIYSVRSRQMPPAFLVT